MDMASVGTTKDIPSGNVSKNQLDAPFSSTFKDAVKLDGDDLLFMVVKGGRHTQRYPGCGDCVDIEYSAYREASGLTIEEGVQLSFIIGAPMRRRGSHDVFAALELVCQKLTIGAEALIKASPKYIYGAGGRPPLYVPFQTVVFEMKIKAIHQPSVQYRARMRQILSYLDEGIQLWEQEEYEDAMEMFASGITDMTDYEESECLLAYQLRMMEKVRIALLHVFMDSSSKVGNFRLAYCTAEAILRKQMHDVKAIAMKARCLAVWSRQGSAIRLLLIAQDLNPGSKELEQVLEEIESSMLDTSPRSCRFNQELDRIGLECSTTSTQQHLKPDQLPTCSQSDSALFCYPEGWLFPQSPKRRHYHSLRRVSDMFEAEEQSYIEELEERCRSTQEEQGDSIADQVLKMSVEKIKVTNQIRQLGINTTESKNIKKTSHTQTDPDLSITEETKPEEMHFEVKTAKNNVHAELLDIFTLVETLKDEEILKELDDVDEKGTDQFTEPDVETKLAKVSVEDELLSLFRDAAKKKDLEYENSNGNMENYYHYLCTMNPAWKIEDIRQALAEFRDSFNGEIPADFTEKDMLDVSNKGELLRKITVSVIQKLEAQNKRNFGEELGT